MKFVAAFTSAVLLATAAFAQQNGITINSLEGVTVCRPSLITWTGGTLCSILPAGQPSAAPLVDFGKVTGNQVTWQVNLQANTQGFLNLRDSTGALGQSAPFTISASSDTACLTQSLSVIGATATGGSTTPTTSGAAAGSGSTTKPTTSGSASPSPSKAAAVSQYANVGAAAVFGAAVLALA